MRRSKILSSFAFAVLLVFMILISSGLASSAPDISFVNPTPLNASSQSNNDIYINISSSDAAQHYTFVDFNNDLVLWYNMDATNGSDPIDLSSYGNNGTLSGGAALNDTGAFGNSTYFDAGGDHINITTTDELILNNSKGNITIAFWVFETEGSGFVEQLFEQDDGYRCQIWHADDRLYCYYYIDGAYRTFFTDSAIPRNAWFHAVTTLEHDGANTFTQKFYIDGANVDNYTYSAGVGTLSVSTSDLDLGTWTGNSNDLRGNLDEFMIFNRTLMPGEIKALYNSSTTQYENNFTNLASGNYFFRGHTVNITGERNQTEQRSVSIDSTVPEVTINFPLNVTYGFFNSTFVFNVSLNENGSVIYSLNNGAINVSMTSEDEVSKFGQNFSHTNSSLGDGNYVFSVYANDTSGNNNYTASVNFSVDSNSLDSCGVLSEANKTYTLNANVSTTGNCFTITASDIILEGGDNEIEGDNEASDVDYGVNVSRFIENVTIRNLNVTNFGTGIIFEEVNSSLISEVAVFSSYRHAILFNASSYNVVDNSTLNSQTLGGSIRLDIGDSGNNFNNITNNECSNNVGGINVIHAFNTLVEKNTCNSNTEAGLYLQSNSNSTTVNNNTFNENGQRGIWHASSSMNVIENNTASSSVTGADGIAISGADAGRFNLVNYNNFSGNDDPGMVISATFNNFTGNILNFNKWGFQTSATGDNNIFVGGEINNNTEQGIVNSGSEANKYINISMDSNGFDAIGIFVAGALNNVFENITLRNTNVSYRDFNITVVGVNGTQIIDTHIGNYSILGGSTLTVNDSRYGGIKFLEGVGGAGNNLSSDIWIRNNSAQVLTNNTAGFNKSAIVSLLGTPGAGITNPAIFRDGETCASGICYNFTSLAAETVLFNVSYWSNYSIGAGTAPETTGSVSSSGGGGGDGGSVPKTENEEEAELEWIRTTSLYYLAEARVVLGELERIKFRFDRKEDLNNYVGVLELEEEKVLLEVELNGEIVSSSVDLALGESISLRETLNIEFVEVQDGKALLELAYLKPSIEIEKEEDLVRESPVEISNLDLYRYLAWVLLILLVLVTFLVKTISRIMMKRRLQKFKLMTADNLR